MATAHMTTVGIDDMALYIPRLYLPIQTLAEARQLAYDKLNQGLGLAQMAVPDAYEDAATMAANAVLELIERNHLRPQDIGRIYLGTESALDGAKPTATYVLEMLRQKLAAQHGETCFQNCDVVDLTFACVGGVDALHNSLEWLRHDAARIGIVVTADNAKYELGSGGEYTQGAGAVALLLRHQPRLLAIGDLWGIGTLGVHDFYKPRRKASKLDLVREVLNLAGIDHISAEEVLARLPQSIEVHGVLDSNEAELSLFKETPVFDGQYSNQCYQDRIKEAFLHFQRQAEARGDIAEGASLLDRWQRLVFHLPYAFHAKRVFSEIFSMEMQRSGQWERHEDLALLSPPQPNGQSAAKAHANYLKEVAKTASYRRFVKEKMERGQRASSAVGNMYACSVFLALMSSLEADWQDGNALDAGRIGLFGYGSGSKSKVFEGQLQPTWRDVVARFQVQQRLEARQALDYATYEALHTGRQQSPVLEPSGTFVVDSVSTEGNTLGARHYRWVEKVAVFA